MKIFIPYYDRGYHIQEANSETARRIGKYWNYNGWIYGDTAYTTREAAEAWINRDYNIARKFEYMPMTYGIINKKVVPAT
jgi:hypothetical protein